MYHNIALTHEDKNASIIITEAMASFFWSRVEKSEGCWEWQGSRFVSGYGKMCAPSARGRKQVKASRVCYSIHFGVIPEGLNVCHTCDNPGCVRPNHLFLGTDKDNIEDCILKGRANRACGSRSGMGKLIEHEVLEMRRLRREELWTYTMIGDEFGVTRMTAWNAVNKTWRHVA